MLAWFVKLLVSDKAIYFVKAACARKLLAVRPPCAAKHSCLLRSASFVHATSGLYYMNYLFQPYQLESVTVN